MGEIWLWILLILLILVAYWFLTVPSGLPPGTAGLPLLGYLPFVEPRIDQTFRKLGEKYGNLFHVYLGSRLVVVLNDYTTTKEAFIKQGDIFSGRPHNLFFNQDLSIVFSEGEYWKHHRRFFLKFLKDYGVGTHTLGPKIMNDIHHFIDEVKKHNGKPFNISDLFNCSLGNNASILLTGKSYDYDHPNIQKTIHIIDTFKVIFKGASLKMFLPWVSYIPGLEVLTSVKASRKVNQTFSDFTNQILKEIREDFTDGNKDNFVEAYMTEINARKRRNDDTFTDLGLLYTTNDLIGGASASTATTLMWATLYLTNYPEIQKKVQAEIDEVIGPEREPSYQDRINMPYTEATIYEILRIGLVGPLSFPRRNIDETSLFGYRIPPGTIIFANLWNIHHDPKLWGDPENFRPDRFLDEKRKLIMTEYVVPFSIGKRSCPGEPLVRIQVFLYIVSLLRKFDFVPPNGMQPTLESIPDFALKPKTGIACAVERQH